MAGLSFGQGWYMDAVHCAQGLADGTAYVPTIAASIFARWLYRKLVCLCGLKCRLDGICEHSVAVAAQIFARCQSANGDQRSILSTCLFAYHTQRMSELLVMSGAVDSCDLLAMSAQSSHLVSVACIPPHAIGTNQGCCRSVQTCTRANWKKEPRHNDKQALVVQCSSCLLKAWCMSELSCIAETQEWGRRSNICNWTEPGLEQLLGEPACAEAGGYEHGGKTLSGQIFRTISCELYYGPFNCNFYWQSDNQ